MSKNCPLYFSGLSWSHIQQNSNEVFSRQSQCNSLSPARDPGWKIFVRKWFLSPSCSSVWETPQTPSQFCGHLSSNAKMNVAMCPVTAFLLHEQVLLHLSYFQSLALEKNPTLFLHVQLNLFCLAFIFFTQWEDEFFPSPRICHRLNNQYLIFLPPSLG